MRKRLLATLSFLGLTGVTPAAQQKPPASTPAQDTAVKANPVKADAGKKFRLQESQTKLQEKQTQMLAGTAKSGLLQGNTMKLQTAGKQMLLQSQVKIKKSQEEQKAMKVQLEAKQSKLLGEEKDKKSQLEMKRLTGQQEGKFRNQQSETKALKTQLEHKDKKAAKQPGATLTKGPGQ
jgi:hypothetical protein